MKFWDSSAIVPLVVEQPASTASTAWLAEDGEVVVWTLTSVEVVSAPSDWFARAGSARVPLWPPMSWGCSKSAEPIGPVVAGDRRPRRRATLAPRCR